MMWDLQIGSADRSAQGEEAQPLVVERTLAAIWCAPEMMTTMIMFVDNRFRGDLVTCQAKSVDVWDSQPIPSDGLVTPGKWEFTETPYVDLKE
jgi:hypothetical protein